MKYRVIIFIAVAIFILFVLTHEINLKELTEQINHFPKERIIYLCLLSIIISVLKSWRFFLLLRKNDIKVTFWQICKVYIAGQSTTPVPGGEAFRTVLMENETGVNPHKTSGPVLMQALTVFFSSAIIAIIGSFIYGILINIALIALVLIIVAIYLIWNKTLLIKVFNKLGEHKKLKKPAVALKATHKGVRKNLLHDGSSKLPGTTFLSSIGIGLLSNMVGGLMIYLIISAYALPVNYIQSIYIYSMSIIIAAVSGIVPGGIGLAEGGITGLLILMRINDEKALAIVLIFRFINLVFYILFGVLFLFLFYSKTLLFAKKNNKK